MLSVPNRAYCGSRYLLDCTLTLIFDRPFYKTSPMERRQTLDTLQTKTYPTIICIVVNTKKEKWMKSVHKCTGFNKKQRQTILTLFKTKIKIE